MQLGCTYHREVMHEMQSSCILMVAQPGRLVPDVKLMGKELNFGNQVVGRQWSQVPLIFSSMRSG